MPWALLLDLRVILGTALVATGLYAAVQRVAKEQCRAEFAQYRADVESEAAKAKVRAAQEAQEHAQHAQEALDDLSTRNAVLSDAYSRLQHSKPNSRPVPTVPSTSSVVSACPGKPVEPDAAAGRLLEVLAAGDREIAKYVELWKLQQKNAEADKLAK